MAVSKRKRTGVFIRGLPPAFMEELQKLTMTESYAEAIVALAHMFQTTRLHFMTLLWKLQRTTETMSEEEQKQLVLLLMELIDRAHKKSLQSNSSWFSRAIRRLAYLFDRAITEADIATLEALYGDDNEVVKDYLSSAIKSRVRYLIMMMLKDEKLTTEELLQIRKYIDEQIQTRAERGE